MATHELTREWQADVAASESRVAWYEPTRPLINLLAIFTATTMLLLFGWLVKNRVITWIGPGDETMDIAVLIAQGQIWLLIWFLLTVITSMLLPIIALLGWWRYVSVRRVLVPFLVVLLAHVASEGIFMQLFFPSMASFTGLLYSSFRVWQLWRLQCYFAAQAQPGGRAHTFIHALLLIGIALWATNLVYVLLIVRIPPVIGG